MRPEPGVTTLTLAEHAAAKINLTLRIVGRRPDGYHELVSLVAFAGVGDALSLGTGTALSLRIGGPFSAGLSAGDDNLVLRAARELAARADGLALGSFSLTKRLPVASGIGGGSADAAAALRLLARANGLSPADPRLFAAAGALGADVPVCVDLRARVMRGIGEILSAPFVLPQLPAVLVNPGVPVETRAVFRALAAVRGGGAAALADPEPEWAAIRSSAALVEAVARGRNDLEPVAISLAPSVAEVLAVLRAEGGCRLARMSGSGATCFGLFDTRRAAAAAAQRVRAGHPAWWVQATTIG
ncbi:MAG: 4-(cytidine 5'-diphospho)-2-C-methyl-D-erythritol kinase [Xanthobacteraceae bacterium]